MVVADNVRISLRSVSHHKPSTQDQSLHPHDLCVYWHDTRRSLIVSGIAILLEFIIYFSGIYTWFSF